MPSPADDETEEDYISPEVMKESLRRRQEIEDGTAKFISLEELDASMTEAIDEVRRSRH